MNWSPQQSKAITDVGHWINSGSDQQVFRLFGFAGSGKTTLAKTIASDIDGDVVYCAFTGKAALVMRSKGCHDARTIHSLIYKRIEDEFVLNLDSAVRDAALVIVDEASMVGPDLGEDLLSFGTKVLVLGDPAQLPPVKGQGFFTDARPDVMLTEIHRQAAESPIIRLATDVREGRRLRHGTYGTSRVITRKQVIRRDVLGSDQVLVGLNNTRRTMNRRIRELLGVTYEYPVEGDRLVCLKNKSDKGLLNGSLWTCRNSDHADNLIKMRVDSIDEPDTAPVDVAVPVEFFQGREKDLNQWKRRQHEEFDFGNALTVHKSQGSQWDNVLLFDESGTFREDARRWLYTGITRAAERVTIVAA